MTEQFRINEDLFLLKHPFYQAWMEGRLSQAGLQDYARQYYSHVAAFPDYLRDALNVCADERAKAVLVENLAEEDGTAHGTSHPELWLRFAEGAGLSREEVKAAKPRDAIRGVVEVFQGCSRASYPEALGAIYAYESQVPEIAESKIEGLKRHFGIVDERSLSFFEVHRIADVEHRETLMALIEALPSDQKADAKKAADEACQVLWDFLSDVHAENA
jgi:pyrroloquinoline-quinone synthase